MHSYNAFQHSNPSSRPNICSCVDHVKEWVTGLQGDGCNNLYAALKLALDIKDVDAIVVVLSSV